MQDPLPPPLDVNAPLVKLIGTARRQIRQAFWARFAAHGLTPQQGWILRILFAHGPMSLHCLSQWVFMDDPTACRIVKTLQDKSLVESIPDPAHGRRNIISVSKAGAKVAPILESLAEDLGRDLEAGLSDAERLQLHATLLKVIANLTRSATPAP
ncbi:MAG: MarR family winged helix-turn-helix transcriptional regulator [Holophaga sp.]|nr:MarR family winged helix-turn-helix transcriptional regulator [Holophaga sp.]